MTGKVAQSDKFADYFVICGLGDKLEPQSNGDEVSPLCQPYKPQVLGQYPDSATAQDDAAAVSMLCLPDGLLFCTQKQPKEPWFHPFLITREDNSRYYGHSLVFYEQVTSHHICTTLHSHQSTYLRNKMTNRQPSHLKDEGGSSHSLPRSFKPKRVRGTEALFDPSQDILYVTKAICLLSTLPLVWAARAFLLGLHAQLGRSAPLLEGPVFHVLHHLPLPRPASCLATACPPGTQLLAHLPGSEDLPLFDYSYKELVGELLGVDNLLDLFTCALLEYQILLLSSDYYRLMLVAEGLTTLLFPFVWPHVYVPILPASLHHFLDAPVPYIMGLHTRSSNLTLPSQANLCLVHIDQQVVEVPEDTPALPHRRELQAEVLAVSDTFTLSRQHSRPPRQASSTLSSPARGNSALHSTSVLTRRAGFTLEDIHRQPSSRALDGIHGYVAMLKLNSALREVFLNFFLNLFLHYEHFVIFPSQTSNKEHWQSSRDCVSNFDKTAFLSDQPQPHLPFLSRFLESQMFATFIDNKILSLWEEPSPQLKVFEARLKNYGSKTALYEPCRVNHQETDVVLEQRVWEADHMTADHSHFPAAAGPLDGFPLLDWALLNQQYRRPVFLSFQTPATAKKPTPPVKENGNRTKMLDVSSVAHCNWKFVDALLKECKTRTKRLLVEKMGQEAVELGHHEMVLSGLEENTLIASLCDLLERVWAHGRISKNGKSALWSHLLSFMEVEECKASGKPLNPNMLTPALAWCLLRKRLNHISTLSLDREDIKEVRKMTEMRTLGSTYLSLVSDVKNIHGMTEIKTDMGYARAWVRLALEKKKLSAYLRHLLSNSELMRSLYKRYAFLRCEDEKEQFLYHLLTLNAVDYLCFTNTFTTTMMSYLVSIVTSCSTTANAWICIAGTLRETGTIALPRNRLDFSFHHKNLGMLSTIRIGHDNSGMSARWMVDQVVVRNEVTGHSYRFPCGRWLGRGVDDGSTERLLVGESLPRCGDLEELGETPTQSGCSSPSIPRRTSEQKLRVPEIQQLLGDAVNSIVKFFYKHDKKNTGMTVLLCGEHGLVYCLEQVFLFAFKATRFFRHFYIWDFLAKVQLQFNTAVSTSSVTADCEGALPPHYSPEYFHVMRAFSRLVDRVNRLPSTVGKDGKFQLFVCLAIRDHWLHRLMQQLPRNPVTATMYEELSFLRDPNLVTFVVQLLASLADFPIELESSITQGLLDP